MDRFYYKFHQKSELGKKFLKLWHECDKANAAAERFAAKVGAKDYYPALNAFAGGVMCVSFENGKPPREKLWRSIGKDADGIEMWVPDVKQRVGLVTLDSDSFIPSDTATRLYIKDFAQKNAKGQTIRKCVELYRDDEIPVDKNHPNRQLPLYIRESIRIERARLTLPCVKTEALLVLLQADFMEGCEGKPRMVKLVTPSFFKYSQSVYLCCAYPCSANDLTEISMGDYAEMEKEVRASARDAEAIED